MLLQCVRRLTAEMNGVKLAGGVLVASLVWGLSTAQAAGVSVKGTGATFPSKVYARWVDRFNELNPSVAMGYTPTGSGEGIKQITARAVQFGGTDTALAPSVLKDKGLIQIPMLIGGLVPAVNVPGVGNNRLLLTGPVLADIMLGKIARWDDEAIRGLNPGLKLPSLPIVRVVRQDKSGSSEGFAAYLAASSADFKALVQVSHKPNWPGKVLEGKGNDGVAELLKSNVGAIAYLSFDRVSKDGLAGVRLRNPAGRDVVASVEGFKDAILGSDVYRKGDDTATLLNTARPGAWPITMTSYMLLDAKPRNLRDTEWAARFVYWCFMHGDDLTKGTGFAPLPDRVQAKLASRLLEIHGPNGDIPKLVVN